jgi:cytochrome P450
MTRGRVSVQYSRELRDYLSCVVEERRREPRDDLVTDLVTAELGGEALDDEEIYSFLRMLLPAGIETTYRSSGNLLYLLLTHPEQLDAIRDDRSLIPQAIEEGRRYESPVMITPRVTARPTTISEVEIPAGTIVTSMLGSANRDPEAYENPETFDIFRDPKQHLSFGAGPHLCLGMHLARLGKPRRAERAPRPPTEPAPRPGCSPATRRPHPRGHPVPQPNVTPSAMGSGSRCVIAGVTRD